MKFNKFIYATMAAALLAACSDKDVIADGPDTGTTTVPEGGDGFVAVRINLPTQPVATPRAINDNFDDGTANEYAVNNGALLLFTGADEKTAVFKSAYNLNLDPWVSAPDKVDNITTSSLVSVKITNPATASDKIYGLVVLNYTNVMTVGTNNTLTIAGSTDPFTGNFEAFARTVSQQPFYSGFGTTASNFFMINAPVSNKIAQNGSVAPTANDITTLVNITDGVKATRAEAEANPAGSFFVERAVAKTTLSTSPTVGAPTSIIDNTGETITFTVKSVEWALDATNTKSFIVRNMYPAAGQEQFIGYKNPKNGGYRMVGNTKIGMTIIQPTVDLYRTYWCYDPNYSTFTEGDLLHSTDMTSVSFVPADGTKHPLYCYENTFDIDHQTHQYTTQALVKVTFDLTKNGTKMDEFYTVNERQNVIYGEADAKANSIAAIIRDPSVAAALQTALNGTGQSISITADNYSQYLTVTFADPDANGIVKVSKVEFVDGCLSSITDAKQPAFGEGVEAKLISDVNTQVRIAKYTDNVAYYSIRIKHFAGDNYNDTNDLAPWNAEYVPVGASSYDYGRYNAPESEKAGNAENMWLGRYGMVRNNWYDITVSSVKKLGAATIPGLDVKGDDNKDDETEQWIAFKVNILSWAKRQQNVEL